LALPLQIKERRNFLVIVDLVLVNVATFIALWIHATLKGLTFDRDFLSRWWDLFILLSILWVISSFATGLYDLSKTDNVIVGAQSMMMTTALVIIAYMALFFFAVRPRALLMRRVVLYQGAVGLILVGAWRLFYGLLMRYPAFSRKVLIVGAGWAGQTIAHALTQHLSAHYQIVGFVDDDPEKQGRMTPFVKASSKRLDDGAGEDVGFPVLGTREELRHLVNEHRVSEIILAVTHDLHGELVRALLDCQAFGVQVTLMPVLYEQIAGRVPIQHIGDHWYAALPLDHPGAGRTYPILKRALDILGALVGLGVYVSLFPIIALAIYLDSPGPIFYRQERVGKGGRVFRLVKLRTMARDAERDGAVFAAQRDPRVTRVGRFLRKARLDEFPQLFNVLRGEMSIVGPRPERLEHLGKLEKEIPFHRMRHAVRPGMTGWAQVNYGYVSSVEDGRIRLEYDLYYIKHQSLWLDLVIILKSVGQVLRFRGR